MANASPDSSKKTRAVAFEFSTTQAYILEFGDQYMRVYRNSGGTASRVFETATPYLEADLEGLQFAQSADVLYVAHKSYAPRKVERIGHTAWTITQIAFDARR